LQAAWDVWHASVNPTPITQSVRLNYSDTFSQTDSPREEHAGRVMLLIMTAE